MNPVLDTVVRSSPAVWKAYAAARNPPARAPAAQPARGRALSGLRATGASASPEMANRYCCRLNSWSAGLPMAWPIPRSYCEIVVTRTLSKKPMMKAPRITPQTLPMPPRMTITSTITEMLKLNWSGLTTWR